MSVVPVNLSDLVVPATPDEELQTSLQIASDIGLPTTAWQSVQMIPALIEVNATIAADYSTTVALMAQGGYASYAALMVDGQGSPITTWMTLIGLEWYGATRVPASFASGPVRLVNAIATAYPYTPNNPLHFQNATTHATYTTVGSGTVAGNATTTVSVQADQAGGGSTTGAGVILVLTTPLNGVTVLALADALVGSDEESNAALLKRGQNKVSTLCPVSSTDQPSPVPGAAEGAYEYVATTIPQAGSASAVPPYAVTSPITRAASVLNTGSGTITLYIANASGAPSGGDVDAVNGAIQNLAVPECITVTVQAATVVVVTVAATLYVKAGAILAADVITNALDALSAYFATVPIGGITTTAPNIVPLSDIVDTMLRASPNTIDVAMSSPATPPSLTTSGIPELGGGSSITVVFV
jgi:hypothetical protein